MFDGQFRLLLVQLIPYHTVFLPGPFTSFSPAFSIIHFLSLYHMQRSKYVRKNAEANGPQRCKSLEDTMKVRYITSDCAFTPFDFFISSLECVPSVSFSTGVEMVFGTDGA